MLESRREDAGGIWTSGSSRMNSPVPFMVLRSRSLPMTSTLSPLSSAVPDYQSQRTSLKDMPEAVINS